MLSQQDQSFVRQAADGSLGEVVLGRIAEQRGGTPAIREFGRWMATDHGLVANRWLEAIMAAQGQRVQPMLSPQDNQLQQRLQRLSVQAQVTDHEKTVPKFQQEARGSRNPMLRNFAETLTPVLQQHLDEARRLAATTEQSGSSTQR
jgi:putative membrane protein